MKSFLQPYRSLFEYNSQTWYVKKMFLHHFHVFTDIPAILPQKKEKFYIYILWITKSYNTLKSHKKHAHAGLRP